MNDRSHHAYYPSAPVKSKASLVWTFETKGPVISSPVVADDVVYVGSEDNNLYALDAQTGQLQWSFATSGAVNSTPLVTRGKVLFLSYDGYFYALAQSTGKLIWKFKTGGESKFKVKDYFNGSFQPDFWDFYLSSAVADDKNVYFGSSDGNLYALDIQTGDKVWQYQTSGSVHSSPALHKGLLVVGTWDSRVYCLKATTGKENWSYTTGRDTAQYVWLGIQASPSIDEQAVYIGSRDGKMYAFDLANGDTLWTNNNFHRSWMPSSAAIGQENIYTGSSDAFSFYSISKATGEINYATKTHAYTFSSPAIDEEMAYIGAANGRMFGIDLASGDIKWQWKTQESQTDTLRVFDDEGKMDMERMKQFMTGIDDMPTLSKLYRKIFAGSGAIVSSPAIDNQVIYFGSYDGRVYAVTDK